LTSSALEDAPWAHVNDRADAHERIGAVIERLHAGGDH
jgi:hypothetical protein